MAPLSEFWAVEYHFLSDTFSVRQVPDYLTVAQTNFDTRKLFDGVIIALHPSEQGAREACEFWQAKRDARSALSIQERLAELRRYAEGLESQL